MMAVGAGFTLYCLFLLQVRTWSAVGVTDLSANAINSDTVTLAPPKSQQDTEEHVAMRREQEEERRSEQVTSHIEEQGLRGVEKLVTQAPAVYTTPEPTEAVATSTEAPALFATSAVPARSFDDRHDVVSGYDAAMRYLANYTTPAGSDEQLFLFFTCGDEQGKQTSWRKMCVDASDVVYDIFSKSPSRNRLVTIHAGDKAFWSSPNAFFKDGDLRVKAIPSIMQWHGGPPGAKRATSGMIIEESLLYEPLLRYLFKNEDVPDPLLTPAVVAKKEIVLLKGYDEFRSYIDGMAVGSSPLPDGPLFLFMIAGRIEANDRLWCPYCRYSEISVEYAFKAFAPEGARLVKVETVNSYTIWKNPKNDWKKDTELMVRGVPWMYRANLDADTHRFTYNRFSERFDQPESLRGVFQGWKNPV